MGCRVAAVAVWISLVFMQPAHAQLSEAETQARIERGALAYFVENSHPVTGLTLDLARNTPSTAAQVDRVASIAATGFSLAVITNASLRGMVEKDFAYQYALRTLRFARDHVPRWKGWFLHFVDWEAGTRMYRSEFSTIDTALFLAGALYAAQAFPKTEVARLAYEIYSDVDFYEFLTDGGSRPNKLTLTMGYIPEEGYIPTQWNMYAEQQILLLLGLGHPTRPLPAESWLAYSRDSFRGMMGLDQALFVHQYSQLFVDFRQFDDSFPNYFENTRRISLYQRDIRVTDARYKTLREGFWGFSAGLAPGNSYSVATATNYSSTTCIGCAIASVSFIPHEVFSDLRAWMESPYFCQIWGRYGLTDSVDLDQNWFSEIVYGITLGPAYLSFANLDESHSVWRLFMKIPEIQQAMERARLASASSGVRNEMGR